MHAAVLSHTGTNTGNGTMTIRVLLVDDDDLMRAGLKLIIDQADGIAVVGEAANGDEAVHLAKLDRPDVVLMDVRMPGTDGITATASITAELNPPRVVMLTTFEIDEYVFDALRAGASGFVLKRTPPEDLIAGIHCVASGEGLLSPSISRRLIEEFAAVPTHFLTVDPRLQRLTDREREVLVLMAKGRSNDDIATELFIAANTVKTHVKHVIAKLDARDRVQAVVAAYEGGLMS